MLVCQLMTPQRTFANGHMRLWSHGNQHLSSGLDSIVLVMLMDYLGPVYMRRAGPPDRAGSPRRDLSEQKHPLFNQAAFI